MLITGSEITGRCERAVSVAVPSGLADGSVFGEWACTCGKGSQGIYRTETQLSDEWADHTARDGAVT